MKSWKFHFEMNFVKSWKFYFEMKFDFGLSLNHHSAMSLKSHSVKDLHFHFETNFHSVMKFRSAMNLKCYF